MEQIVNPVGRILFPEPKFRFDGLEEESKYKMGIRFERLSKLKFSYSNEEFVETQKRAKGPKNIVFDYPEIKKGKEWNEKGVKFSIKVTNNEFCKCKEAVLLDSQCKYEMVLIVTKIGENDVREFRFDCLKFITVTVYCNQKVQNIKSGANKYSCRNSKTGRKLLKMAELMEEEPRFPLLTKLLTSPIIDSNPVLFSQ